MRPEQLRAGVMPGNQPLAYLFSGLAVSTVPNQRPASDHSGHRFIEQEAMLGGQSDGLVRVMQRFRRFATKLIQDRRKCQRVSYSVRLCCVPRQRERFLNWNESALWPAQEPQRPACKAA